ncbi:hypothetical protein EVAR_63231_1 [Eumeta japonica]|uniref:Uncharacterized protein n=1 Tax=Eumeta variegata TaxID=151549 RepID=A0A4C1ZA97_EUMVA|nr:hypothetical protein EVAR_63231_1 [Eumeta japonica]
MEEQLKYIQSHQKKLHHRFTGTRIRTKITATVRCNDENKPGPYTSIAQVPRGAQPAPRLTSRRSRRPRVSLSSIIYGFLVVCMGNERMSIYCERIIQTARRRRTPAHTLKHERRRVNSVR